MADDEGGSASSGGRITHAQVIESTLITVGYPETLDKDLDYAGEVLSRAVDKLRNHEKSLRFQDVTEKDKLKAIFVLNTMYALQRKTMASAPSS